MFPGNKFIDLAKTPEEEVRKNWAMLREQNVRKANYIISGNNVLPDKKMISIKKPYSQLRRKNMCLQRMKWQY